VKTSDGSIKKTLWVLRADGIRPYKERETPAQFSNPNNAKEATVQAAPF
jgi:hypothetical protein